jgi:hypothetical protein
VGNDVLGSTSGGDGANDRLELVELAPTQRSSCVPDMIGWRGILASSSDLWRNMFGACGGGGSVRDSFSDHLRNAWSICGIPIGPGTGGLGSGGGELDTGSGGSIRGTRGGVLHNAMSMHRSIADLASGSCALGRGDGLRRGFLSASGAAVSTFHASSREHAAVVLATIMTYWVVS